MKQFVKALARRAGLVVATTGHSAARYLEHPPRGPFDEVLLRVFPSLLGLSFIQVGANDGIRADPIRRYVTTCGWTGVLVEPDPALFRSLEANYAAQASQLKFLNAAIDAAPGERLIHQIAAETPNVPEWARGVVSFDLAHVQRIAVHVGLPETVVKSAPVRTTTWEEVRLLFGSRRCDVLVIDVEGYDITLLRLANLAVLKPRVVQFEHACVSRGERLSFYSELLDFGYEIATSDIDTIAYFPNRPAEAGPAAAT